MIAAAKEMSRLSSSFARDAAVFMVGAEAGMVPNENLETIKLLGHSVS